MDNIFRIDFSEMEEDETTQWFWAINRQALFSSNKESRQLKYMISLPKGDRGRYNRLAKYKNKLIMIPATANEVLIYDITVSTSRKLPLPAGIWNRDAEKKGKFGRGIIYDQYLVLLPSWSNILCKIDMEQEKIVSFVNISDTGIATNGAIPFCKALLVNEYIYMTAGEEPSLIILNAKTLQYKKKVFTHYAKGFSSIIRYGEYFWLLPRYKGEIIKWNPETDEEKRYSIPEKLLPPGNRAGFNSAQRIGDNVWIFPVTAPEVLRFNIRTEKLEIEEIFKKYSIHEKETDAYIKYRMTKAAGAVLKVYSAIKGVLVQYDTEKGELQELPYYISDDDKLRYFIETPCGFDNILSENAPVNLSEYLVIMQKRDYMISRKAENIIFGKKIYQMVRSGD